MLHLYIHKIIAVVFGWALIIAAVALTALSVLDTLHYPPGRLVPAVLLLLVTGAGSLWVGL